MQNSIINFHLVNDLLSTGGQPTEAQLIEISHAGFQTVINLALHDNSEYSLPDERHTVEELGMVYIHIPVQFDCPTRQDLKTFFEAMAQNKGKKIFVHCAMNMRVSAFVGLYLKLIQNLPDEVSFALMRKVWQPNEVWSEFITEMQTTFERK